MTLYRYRAVDRKGLVVSGYVSGIQKRDVSLKLFEQGLDILSLCTSKKWLSFFERDQKAVHQEFFTFCLYLEHFSQAGLPFLEGLEEMKKHFQGAFQGILESISQEINAGVLFSQALAQHPKLFDPVFVSLVEVGEKTGDISTVFQKLTQYVKQNEETKTQIKQALRYPLFVGITLVGAILGIFIFLVPPLLEFLLVLDIPLSFATKSLLFVSSFFPWGALFCVSGGILGSLFFSFSMAYFPLLRRQVHTLFLKIPVLGKLLSKTVLSRVFYALSVMLDQGVDLLQGLEIAQRGIRQERLLADFQRVIEEVTSGLSLSQALSRHPFFRGPLFRMIQIGEETGRLSQSLHQVSQLYRRESKEQLDFLASLLEPICLSVLGLLLTWVIMATFMPLYESFHFVDGSD